jgi:ribonuclease VapC
MVLDRSAIVAIHLKEAGYEGLLEVIEGAIDRAEVLFVGVPTLLETAMVLTARLGKDARPLLAGFLRQIDAEVVAFNREHFDAAAEAFLKFGKGRHQAALNFGDCMSYAVASVAEMPLLFTGEDFSHTDIQRTDQR